jgi:hypothetical protein
MRKETANTQARGEARQTPWKPRAGTAVKATMVRAAISRTPEQMANME